MRERGAQPVDQGVLDRQREQWTRTFETREDFMGAVASEPANKALERFRAAGVRELLELGPGQGRDTLFFAGTGLRVTALDYSQEGLDQIARKVDAPGLAGTVKTVRADVRARLPLPDASFDACYAHLLFCMALTTPDIERLAADVRRVLRPGGFLVYTVRNSADPHYGSGTSRGDGMWETNGFIVHFFDRALIDRLAGGFEVVDVADYQEGMLPIRFFGVTMRKP